MYACQYDHTSWRWITLNHYECAGQQDDHVFEQWTATEKTALHQVSIGNKATDACSVASATN